MAYERAFRRLRVARCPFLSPGSVLHRYRLARFTCLPAFAALSACLCWLVWPRATSHRYPPVSQSVQETASSRGILTRRSGFPTHPPTSWPARTHARQPSLWPGKMFSSSIRVRCKRRCFLQADHLRLRLPCAVATARSASYTGPAQTPYQSRRPLVVLSARGISHTRHTLKHTYTNCFLARSCFRRWLFRRSPYDRIIRLYSVAHTCLFVYEGPGQKPLASCRRFGSVELTSQQSCHQHRSNLVP